MEEAFYSISDLDHVWICLLVGWKGLFWVEEHTSAKTHASVVSLQDIVILASLATLPELLVICQL